MTARQNRVHTHNTYQVNVVNNRLQQFYFGVWVNGNTCFHARSFYLLYVAVQVSAGFVMHR